MKIRQLPGFSVLFAALLFLSPAIYAESGRLSLTFGVVPQQASEKLANQWIPLIRYLSEKTGMDIQFVTAPSIPEFEKRLAEGAYDLAYMNPYDFTIFNADPGYRALAGRNDHQVKGIVVVAKNSGIRTVEELAGKDIAFPAPRAFAATMITRSHLDQTAPGYQAHFVKSHDSVYRAVAEGVFLAGGGIARTLKTTDQDVAENLEILWLSPGYTSHVIAATPALPDEVFEKIQKGLVALSASEHGESILTTLGMPDGFRAAKDEDWDDVRRLNLPRD